MCGIIAYVGQRDAPPILLEGLGRLEYRGYDSAGMAVQNGTGLVTRRIAGRIGALAELIEAEPVQGTSGIAHTRWATHGPPTTENAHPHVDCAGGIAVVHNGIIENASLLRAQLEAAGHTFVSETDTEVLAHLIEEHWLPPLHLAVARALALVEGTYGIAVMSAKEPGRIVCARRGSPLMLGIGEGENFASSDATSIIAHTRRVVYLDDGEMAVLDGEGCDIVDMSVMNRIVKPIDELEWNVEEAERGGYPHYMLKEIHEQPEAISNTMRGRLLPDRGTARLGGLTELADQLAEARRVVIVACGTSWHAGMIGKYMIEEYARVQTDIEYAAEWRYRNPVLEPGTVVLAISQSGETADTLAAVNMARELGCPTIGIVNVVGSSIARKTDGGIYVHAGPEIGVASTKAFSCQVVALALFALYLARQRDSDRVAARRLVEGLRRLPAQVEEVLRLDDEIRRLARRLTDNPNFLYLGRGYSYPVALEGALKLKEISYVHAEGFSAAEMKHGPIALIDEEMPVVVVAPRDAAYSKVLSNAQEVKARGGRLLGITTGPNGLRELSDDCIVVPTTIDALQPILTSIPLQMLAYHIGVLRGCDVDKPRNLAKSVTVE
jgi:glucosamine--fructose-6-phosphate aminotransferase (isomerizing)